MCLKTVLMLVLKESSVTEEVGGGMKANAVRDTLILITFMLLKMVATFSK